MTDPTALKTARTALGGSYAQAAVLGGVTLVALALRLAGLDLQPLWWDEGYSVYFATQDLVTLTLRTASDIHPPLYYYLLYLWIALFGAGAETVRLLSVFTGVLIVPALYAVGRRCAGPRAALIAAALAAVSPVQVYYSQEVRMYALATLLGLGSVFFAQRILFAEPDAQRTHGRAASAGDWLGYVIATSLAVYTLYYAAFVPLFQAIYVLANWRRYRGLVLRWLAADLAIGASFAPWVVMAGGILVNYVGAKMVVEARTAVSLPGYLWDHLTAFSVGHALGGWNWLVVGALPLGSLALLGLLVRGPLRARAGWLACWLGIPVAAGFALNVIYPFSPVGYQRFLLYAQPAFLLLVAAGLDWVTRRPISPLGLARTGAAAAAALSVAGVLLPLALFYTTPRYAGDDYRPLIGQIAALGHPDDAVLCVFPWQVGYLESYLPDPLTRPRIVEAPESAWSRDESRLRGDLDSLLYDARRVWFPAHQKHGAILERQVETYLSQAGFPVANDWFGDTRLYVYAPGGPSDTRTAALRFDRFLGLNRVSLGNRPAEAGLGIVPVELEWRLSETITADYSVKLRLVDSAGRTWGQRDSAPVAGRRPFSTWSAGESVTDRHGLLIPAGTPPGSYEIRLSVYARATTEALNVLDAAGRVLGPEVTLGQVQVTRSAFRPPVAALHMQAETGAEYTGGLRLLGYTAPAGPVRPGDRLSVSLYWQGGTSRALPYVAFLQLQDAAGKPWALSESPDLGNGFTLEQLDPGEPVRAQFELLLPATAPDGQYRLVAGLLSPVDKSRLTGSMGAQVLLTEVTVRGRPHSNAVPAMQQTSGARFGDLAELLGFDLTRDAAGRGAAITLYWRALKETSTSYSVFLHLTDEKGTIRGQRDAIPQAGAAPTTSWVPGEVISDTYALQARPEAPAGTYRVVAGMYVEGGGPRLPVTAPGAAPADFAALAVLEVAP